VKDSYVNKKIAIFGIDYFFKKYRIKFLNSIDFLIGADS